MPRSVAMPPKRCSSCLSCSVCKDDALIHSRKEQDELEMLQNNIKLKDGRLQVTYPFLKSPEGFPNYRSGAIAMAQKQEQRLMKKGMLEKYSEELFKYVTRGILVPISEEEKQEYQGPVNYIRHHAVEKPSPTTPFRIVTNSSLKNGGKSLNDCLPKGPNSLNSMWDVMVRFRCHKVGLVFDLTKAYNSFHTWIVEKHLRRLIWRFSPEDDWIDYGFVVVAFGGKPPGDFLELGKQLCAEAGKKIHPSAAIKIVKDSYVDDHITGGSASEVKKMMGERKEDGSYTGYKWHATDDVIAVALPINTSGRVRKMKQRPDVTEKDQDKFMKRICLSLVNSLADFIEIAAPYLLNFQLLIKQVFERKICGMERRDTRGQQERLVRVD